MGKLDEWWLKEKQKTEFRDHQITELQSRIDQLQDVSDSSIFEDYPKDEVPPFTQGKTVLFNEWLSNQNPDNQDAYMKSLRQMSSQPCQKKSIFQSFKCFWGIHDWSKWSYDSQDRIKIKRECQHCHIRQMQDAESNDLVPS